MWTITFVERSHLSGNCLTLLRNIKWRQILKSYSKLLIWKSNSVLDTVICGVSVKWPCYMVTSSPFKMSSAIVTALSTQKPKYQNTQSLDMILHILVLDGCVFMWMCWVFVCLSLQAIMSNFLKNMFIFACLDSSSKLKTQNSCETIQV